MHIILGGTGHIGSALAKILLDKGEEVTVITSDASKTKALEEQGYTAEVVDIHHVNALRDVFRKGKRAFLLNPPADPSTDTVKEEMKTVKAILEALEDSGLEKVVAESTYGAQPTEEGGDLGVLYELEQGLADQPIPASIIRGAYYMTNWDMSRETTQKEGVVHTFFPVDFKLPMVDPKDIAVVAARLMTEPAESEGFHYVEGPERYSSKDVADAFSEVLGKPAKAVETPREGWLETFKAIGFSDEAANSYAGMTAITLERPELPDEPERGSTTIQDYVTELVRRESN
jgi:uncharacterized protein YbjT (DUF2867 family)